MIGELVMRCFHARTAAHVLHLKGGTLAKHMALQEFYEGVIPLIDSLAEAYQGDYDLISNFPARYTHYEDGVALMTDLSDWIEKNRHKCWDADDTYLENIVDEIVKLIRQTTYKLRHLK